MGRDAPMLDYLFVAVFPQLNAPHLSTYSKKQEMPKTPCKSVHKRLRGIDPANMRSNSRRNDAPENSLDSRDTPSPGPQSVQSEIDTYPLTPTPSGIQFGDREATRHLLEHNLPISGYPSLQTPHNIVGQTISRVSSALNGTSQAATPSMPFAHGSARPDALFREAAESSHRNLSAHRRFSAEEAGRFFNSSLAPSHPCPDQQLSSSARNSSSSHDSGSFQYPIDLELEMMAYLLSNQAAGYMPNSDLVANYGGAGNCLWPSCHPDNLPANEAASNPNDPNGGFSDKPEQQALSPDSPLLHPLRILRVFCLSPMEILPFTIILYTCGFKSLISSLDLMIVAVRLGVDAVIYAWSISGPGCLASSQLAFSPQLAIIERQGSPRLVDVAEIGRLSQVTNTLAGAPDQLVPPEGSAGRLYWPNFRTLKRYLALSYSNNSRQRALEKLNDHIAPGTFHTNSARYANLCRQGLRTVYLRRYWHEGMMCHSPSWTRYTTTSSQSKISHTCLSSSTSSFMAIPLGRIKKVLGHTWGNAQFLSTDLHSIVYLPKVRDPDDDVKWHEPELRLYRASLHDFLLDPTRSEDIFRDPQHVHAHFAQCWIR
ncbi:hypothetical protein BDZ97DRAFT_2057762 [Flammula alnicola]|nr:hypothetical protein BDZ97DRAFT_2057762 [Flammula alnicola]